jgi:hypothetical protein
MSAEQVKRSPPAQVTSADFRKRAQHYRLASALADIPRDAAMFDELASMFDQIACLFGRAEEESSVLHPRHLVTGLSRPCWIGAKARPDRSSHNASSRLTPNHSQ